MRSDPYRQQPTGDPCADTARELGTLDVLHAMLRVLNEPAASAADLAGHVARIPPLVARVERELKRQTLKHSRSSLKEQLVRLGNREFERVLLAFLEDLTELRASTEP